MGVIRQGLELMVPKIATADHYTGSRSPHKVQNERRAWLELHVSAADFAQICGRRPWRCRCLDCSAAARKPTYHELAEHHCMAVGARVSDLIRSRLLWGNMERMMLDVAVSPPMRGSMSCPLFVRLRACVTQAWHQYAEALLLQIWANSDVGAFRFARCPLVIGRFSAQADSGVWSDGSNLGHYTTKPLPNFACVTPPWCDVANSTWLRPDRPRRVGDGVAVHICTPQLGI